MGGLTRVGRAGSQMRLPREHDHRHPPIFYPMRSLLLAAALVAAAGPAPVSSSRRPRAGTDPGPLAGTCRLRGGLSRRYAAAHRPVAEENPSTPPAYRDTTYWMRPEHRPAAILATHPHSDHDADVALLARVTGRRWSPSAITSRRCTFPKGAT